MVHNQLDQTINTSRPREEVVRSMNTRRWLMLLPIRMLACSFSKQPVGCTCGGRNQLILNPPGQHLNRQRNLGAVVATRSLYGIHLSTSARWDHEQAGQAHTTI